MVLFGKSHSVEVYFLIFLYIFLIFLLERLGSDVLMMSANVMGKLRRISMQTTDAWLDSDCAQRHVIGDGVRGNCGEVTGFREFSGLCKFNNNVTKKRNIRKCE